MKLVSAVRGVVKRARARHLFWQSLSMSAWLGALKDRPSKRTPRASAESTTETVTSSATSVQFDDQSSFTSHSSLSPSSPQQTRRKPSSPCIAYASPMSPDSRCTHNAQLPATAGPDMDALLVTSPRALIGLIQEMALNQPESRWSSERSNVNHFGNPPRVSSPELLRAACEWLADFETTRGTDASTACATALSGACRHAVKGGGGASPRGAASSPRVVARHPAPASPKPAAVSLPRSRRQITSSGAVTSPHGSDPCAGTNTVAHPLRILRARHYQQHGQASYRSAADRFGNYNDLAMLNVPQAANPGAHRFESERPSVHRYQPVRDARGEHFEVAKSAASVWDLPAVL